MDGSGRAGSWACRCRYSLYRPTLDVLVVVKLWPCFEGVFLVFRVLPTSAQMSHMSECCVDAERESEDSRDKGGKGREE